MDELGHGGRYKREAYGELKFRRSVISASPSFPEHAPKALQSSFYPHALQGLCVFVHAPSL